MRAFKFTSIALAKMNHIVPLSREERKYLTDNEDLRREWYVRLSNMVGENLDPNVTLKEATDWFVASDDVTHDRIRELSESDNQTVREFFVIGNKLLGYRAWDVD